MTASGHTVDRARARERRQRSSICRAMSERTRSIPDIWMLTTLATGAHRARQDELHLVGAAQQLL